MSIAVKLSTLRGCVAEEEVKLTLDVLLKGLVRRPLRRTRVPFVLLPVALLSVGVSRPLKTIKVRPVLVAVMVVVGTLVAVKITSVAAEVWAVMILGKIGQREQRKHGQQKRVDNHGLKGGLMKKLMGKEMAMKICIR
jgi:hypothetical protein